MEIRTIGVVGAGQMGNGIAHVAAQAGFDVVMRDVEDAFVEKGLATIDKNLQRGVDKGKIEAADKAAILERVTGTTALGHLSACDLVVEAIVENLEAKTRLFASLDEITRDEIILATNTSSIAVTQIAAATKRPDRVIGMHFMN
ncbi:MAG: 3-hydroxyacyl-CoA dehydrogenase NAD-binding domain-containing protein, partial [Acidobacteriota bacterium]|nr:3-hydroxyacyl-CoA dehydrogenase NAD-binding domain-containing protein [Acidobacteriota bacterium]